MKLPFTADEFTAWRESPVSEQVFRYLSDRREMLAERAKSAFLSGSPAFDLNEQAYAIAIENLMALDFTAIEAFYADEEKDEQPVEQVGP